MRTIKRLTSYIRYDLPRFLTGNLLLLLAVALNMILPQIGKFIIDDLLMPLESLAAFAWQPLTRAILAYLLVGFSGALIQYAASYLLVLSSNRFTEELRNQVYQHVHSMPIQYFDTVPAGTIVSRITNDTETIRVNFYINVFANMLISCIRIIGILVALATVRWEISAVLLLVLPGILLFQKVYSDHAAGYLEEMRELHGQINGKINEMIKNVEMTQSYGREGAVMDRFRDLTERQWKVSDRFLRFDWAMFNIPEHLIRLIMFGSVFWLISRHLRTNFSISPGELYLVINYVTLLLQPVTLILDVLAQIVRSIVSANRVFELLDMPVDQDGDLDPEEVEGRLELKDIHFAYLEDRPVLRGLDFEALPGQTVAIVGPTGSGKSTLLNLLFRFYDPEEGQALLDGTDLKNLKRRPLRKHMGMVLQDPFLLEASLYDNISLHNENITREEAEQALRRVGGGSFFESPRKGLDEAIQERGKNLSAGQRQLISFARALAYDPKILILDEATASIDTETEQMIQSAMEVVKKGRTTVIIAHRLSTIRDSDCIYVLKEGRVVEKGSHDDLMKKKKTYYEMVALQGIAKADPATL